MEKLKTHFEQIPVAIVKKIAVLDVPSITTTVDEDAETAKAQLYIIRAAGVRKS